MKNPATRAEELEVLNSFGYRVILPVAVQEGEYALLEFKSMPPLMGDMDVVTTEARYILAWKYIQVGFVRVITRTKDERTLGVHVRVSLDTPKEFSVVGERLARSLHKS
jgi:hypothetical protein